MSITGITIDELRRMEEQEGLVLQGCGGPLQDWLNGINSMLSQAGILKNGTKFEDIHTFQNEGATCMLFPFTEDVQVDMGMTKPLDEEEMLWRIKALLRRARIVSERRIVIGDIVLDYDSMTVSKKGEIYEMPQKEFLLLYKLLSYPGQIFTRIQLMDEIWGADCETGWETVTVHIGRLRKRFEVWNEFEIVSIRGLGYKAVKKV